MAKKHGWKDNAIGRAMVEPVMKAGPKINGPLNAARGVIVAINKAPGPNRPVPPANPIKMASGGTLKPPKGFKAPKRRGR